MDIYGHDPWISWMLHYLNGISLSQKNACQKLQISKISVTKVESEQFKPKILRNSFRASDDLDGFFAFLHPTHIALVVFPEIGKWWTIIYMKHILATLSSGGWCTSNSRFWHFLTSTILYACHVNHQIHRHIQFFRNVDYPHPETKDESSWTLMLGKLNHYTVR